MKKVIIIVGPTAVGKSHIAIKIAKHFNLEIISGDSVAVYKQLNIGSAKPTKEQLKEVKHHLIDILEPTQQYSVADFQKNARSILENLDVGLIVGGTGLYINSVIYDYEFGEFKTDETLEAKYKNHTNEQLYKVLLSLDKTIDETKIHPNNRKRVLRAINVFSNSKNSVFKTTAKNKLIYKPFIIYLNIENKGILYERINHRVDEMMSLGLLDEVKGLYDKNIKVNAIGYKEFIDYFEKSIKLEEVVNNIKQNSRKLAKRQMTWFRNQLKTNAYSVNLEDINQTIEEIKKDILSFLKG